MVHKATSASTWTGMLITTFRGLPKYVYFLGINPAPQNSRLIRKTQQQEQLSHLRCLCKLVGTV
jgi:hypothetical protein